MNQKDPRIVFCYEATAILFTIKNWRDEVGYDALPEHINVLVDGICKKATQVAASLTTAA